MQGTVVWPYRDPPRRLPMSCRTHWFTAATANRLMKSDDQIDLSIIIVTHNDWPLLRACLESIFCNTTSRRYAVWVIDNDSSDGTPELVKARYPQVTLIKNDANLGYAQANNVGICQSRSRYVLLLNPDVKIPPYTVDEMLRLMDSETDIGIVGPKLVRPDGDLDYACRRMFPNYLDFVFWLFNLYRSFPRSHKVGRYNLLYLNPDEPTEVEAVAGAFMLARRSAIDKVGKLDERFFIYGEDLDWCYRFVLAGWRVLYYPKIVVLHHKGGTTRRISQRMIYHFYRSNYLLYKKHLAPRTPALLNWFLYGAVFLRFLLSYAYNLMLPAGKKRVA